MEGRLFMWIPDRQSKKLRISQIMIMKKAKLMYDQMKIEDAKAFSARRGWLEKFMWHHRLSLQKRTY